MDVFGPYFRKPPDTKYIRTILRWWMIEKIGSESRSKGYHINDINQELKVFGIFCAFFFLWGGGIWRWGLWHQQGHSWPRFFSVIQMVIKKYPYRWVREGYVWLEKVGFDLMKRWIRRFQLSIVEQSDLILDDDLHFFCTAHNKEDLVLLGSEKSSWKMKALGSDRGIVERSETERWMKLLHGWILSNKFEETAGFWYSPVPSISISISIYIYTHIHTYMHILINMIAANP